MSVESAHKIVRNYANFAASSPPRQGAVSDVNTLPHSKERIKEAIATCLESTSDDEFIEELKYGYLMLCAWQPNVGQPAVALNFSEFNFESSPHELVQRLRQHSEKIHQWQELIEADKLVLTNELQQLLGRRKVSGSNNKPGR